MICPEAACDSLGYEAVADMDGRVRRTLLAVGGPLDGDTLTVAQGCRAGYVLTWWPSGEAVFTPEPLNLDREAARARMAGTSEALAAVDEAFTTPPVNVDDLLRALRAHFRAMRRADRTLRLL